MIVETDLANFDAGQLPPDERRALLACGWRVAQGVESLRISWDCEGLRVATTCPTFYRVAYDLGELPRVWAPRETFEGKILPLVGAYLPAAYFLDVRANGVSWEAAHLAGASFRGACLNGASLKEADLTGANLANAELCRADLSGANLTGATLAGADLTGANLDGAVLCGASLPELNPGSGVHFGRANLLGVRWRSRWTPPGWRLVGGALVPHDLARLGVGLATRSAVATVAAGALDLLVRRVPRGEEGTR